VTPPPIISAIDPVTTTPAGPGRASWCAPHRLLGAVLAEFVFDSPVTTIGSSCGGSASV
jgi:hypothetical protein